MEQSKKLKNMFRVTGSETLRKAFREELNNLGFREQGSSNSDYIAVYGGSSGYHYNYDKSYTNHVGTEIYSLPHDWDKALAAAQDYEEVWPKYGKFISPKLKHLTENKIYKLTGEINIGMSDHCYEFINDLGEGDTAHITHFEIVQEEGYLKQEAEPKVGDYIYFLKDISYKHQGDIVKIDRLDKDSYNGKAWIKYENDGFRWGGNGYQLGVDFRKATEEEIKKATEIKVGDIVVCISNTADSPQGAGYESGLVFTVIEIKSTSNGLCYFGGKYNNGVYSSWIRKATPQEIEAFKDKLTLIVSGYQAEVMNGKIAFGCQHLSKQTLQELNGVACYVDITIGDTKITKGLLTKLINKL